MTGALLAIVVGLAPSMVWIWFFLREDEAHPEPKKLLLYVFLSGAAMTFFVYGPQVYLVNLLSHIDVGQFSALSLLLLAGLEEAFKFLAVYLTVGRHKEFDEPLDAMIYMIVAALGFAAIENVASLFQPANALIKEIGPFEVTSLRFVGATLLHSLSSGLVGYYWGMAKACKRNIVPYIIEGIGVAAILHAIFNYLILIFEPETLLAPLFLVAIAFFVLNDFEELKQREGLFPAKRDLA